MSTHRSITSRSEFSPSESPPLTARPVSVHSTDRRPFGPRSPSPLPPKSPRLHHSQDLPSMDDDDDMDPSSSSSQPFPQTPNIKRSHRQPLFPSSNTESTPKSQLPSGIPIATPIEPLSIKKKTSLRNSVVATNSPTPVKKLYTRNSPLSKTLHRVVSPRRVSPSIRKSKPAPSSSARSDEIEHMHNLAVSTKEDVRSLSHHIGKWV